MMRELIWYLLFCFLCFLGGDGYRRDYGKGDFNITDKNLTFQLFTRENRYKGVTLYIGDKSKLLSSGFNGSLPTKMCTHGYMNHGNTGYIMKIKEGLLNEEKVNFISLDWSICAKNLLYDKAIICMKEVGRYAADFLKFLQKEGKLDVKNIHLIGHSLGAHLMAFTSSAFGPPKTIARVTGLDPAGPLFEHAAESERLNSKSAVFVDVIHTCRVFTGIKKPVGTVDFYPNGGYNQPGCSVSDLACHHRSSTRYFIETLGEKNRNKYVANKCKTLQNAINGTCYGESGSMGYYSEKCSPGIYYLKVTS